MLGGGQYFIVQSVKYFLLFFLSFYLSHSFAQTDSVPVNGNQLRADTTKFKLKDYPNPKKAACYSIFPGGGQIYNKKYWKVPIIYAGLGTLGYFIVQNHKQFKLYKDAYIQRFDTSVHNYSFPEMSQDNLLIQTNTYEKRRDILIISTCLVYLFQIVDACVDAHFASFDISDNLSLNVNPYLNNNSLRTVSPNNWQAGVALNFKLKH
jgi:hypothetical protein